MALDLFLKLDGIDGEAQDSKHQDEIDVLSYTWGMTQSGTTHMGGGSGSGKVDVQDLGIVKFVDRSTPAIHKHCTTGQHIDSFSGPTDRLPGRRFSRQRRTDFVLP